MPSSPRPAEPDRPDPYAVLGVPPSASDEQVTRAYRQQARRLHPDAATGSAAQFAELADAYAVLGDADRRREYDRSRATARPLAGRAGVLRVPVRRAERPGRTPRPQRGRDLSATAALTLRQAVSGATLDVRVEDGRTLRVRVPPGVEDGQRVRVAGAGAPGRDGGPPGDLVLRARVQPDERFRRVGDDLAGPLPVSWPEAVLGGRVRVSAPTGSVEVDLPPGTPPGAVLRVPGAGVPGRGDLLLTVQVDVPSALGDAPRALVERLRDDVPPPPR